MLQCLCCGVAGVRLTQVQRFCAYHIFAVSSSSSSNCHGKGRQCRLSGQQLLEPLVQLPEGWSPSNEM